MKDKLLYAYVSTRTRIVTLPQRLRAIAADEQGSIGDYISTGMMVAAAVVIGGGILAVVPGLVHNWINNLLTNCLSNATAGTTGAGCP